MYKYLLESAGEIDWMAIIPLLIFFLFFVVTSIRAIVARKDFVSKMASLPLEEVDESLNPKL